MSKKEEMILVVPRALFDSIGAFQGLNFEIEHYLPQFLNRANNHFMPRSQAETDPSFKQIIPYILFVHAGRVLHYVRGKKSGEQRLASKGSIGIGGHVNDQDQGLSGLDAETFRNGVNREINEELTIDGSFQTNAVALLNDDSNEVGQVHLGVVHVCRLESDRVQPGEAVISEMQFLSLEELRTRKEQLESWSQICLDHLDSILKKAQE